MSTARPARAAALGDHPGRPAGGDPADQGRAAGAHRGLRPHGRGGVRRRRGAGRGRGRARSRRRRQRGETGLAGHRLRRHRGRHGRRRRSWPSCSRRGCLVVRGHFPREQALGWDRDIVDYVESNRFFENYRGPGDDFFGSVGSKPEIYPIYWSPAQMQARQSDRMARVQAFLNSQWTQRVRRRAVVRPGPRLALPGPDPPPPAGRRLRPASAPTSTPARSTCG